MNIEFVNENTVKITASLEWFAARPTSDLKKIQKKDYFINEFVKQYPAYKVDHASGPDQICNFREESNSKGEWTFTVTNVKKTLKTKRKADSQPAKPSPVKKKILRKGV